jgi:demethylmenaquinone methyltransferase/2-methoxy-6-polyprenyl-1,4-benzoquinol methylase
VTFQREFNCLWCGRSHTARGPDDVEGWAQLCPDCVGRAGDNGFLRFRLKTALAERARGGSAAETRGTRAAAPAAPAEPTEPVGATLGRVAEPAQGAAASPALHDEMLAYYVARAPEYDEFYLRQGRYARGAIHDMAWQVDLDVATRWLDGLPLRGEIVELAAGTGWWSPLLAQKGELHAYDAADAPLDRARERLLAHNLRAHLHRRDAWAAPDREVDAVFTGFWLSHVARTELPRFLALVRRWLRPGGSFAFIDSRRDPQAGADTAREEPEPGVQVRTLNDGRRFRVVKEYYEPGELERALREAGFDAVHVETTSRFFLLGSAVAA